jgi:uncharacterized protein YcfJ
MHSPSLSMLLCLLLLPGMSLSAWGLGFGMGESKNRVVMVENVKLDYAQVLNVEPVYQTLRASRVEEQCDPEPVAQPAPAMVAAEPEQADEGRVERMLDSVKQLFSRRREAEVVTPVPAPAPTSTRRNCKVVELQREFRRPIAYDVDYVYKGTKYRSRLPDDPGNRLRIRVSVTPYIPDAIVTPPR